MKIGDIETGKLPLIVGTVCTDLNFSIDKIEKVDILEIRIDMLQVNTKADITRVVRSIKTKYNKPIIATIRSLKEGGLRNFDDDERYQIYNDIIPYADIFDIELSSTNEVIKKVAQLCEDNNKSLLASYHNFNETPEKDFLLKLIEKGKDTNATIVKIAVKANSKEDLGKLINFTIENKDKNIITISLGNIGLVSRIITPLIGSLMIYGFIDQTSSIGQISVFDLIEYMRLFDPVYNEYLIERFKLLESK